MFKLKFSDTKSREFLMAYSKVMQFTGFKDTKIAYNVAKIGRKFDAEAKICQELFIKLLKNYAKLEENGELAPREDEVINAKSEKVKIKVPNTYQILPEKIEDGSWAKALEEFDASEFEVHCHKIKLADLDGAKLSPLDLTILDPLITELEPAPSLANGAAIPTPIKGAPLMPAPAPTAS